MKERNRLLVPVCGSHHSRHVCDPQLLLFLFSDFNSFFSVSSTSQTIWQAGKTGKSSVILHFCQP